MNDQHDDDTPQVEELSILEQALAECPRDDSGNVDEAVLVKLVALKVEVDIDAAKVRKAKQIINSSTKPGSTPSEGDLTLFDTYPYEPLRLVRDDNGNIVEQDRARFNMKQAEARRARRHVDQSQVWANRKTREAEDHAAWVVEQTKAERDEKSLTFGAFVRESGVFTPTVDKPGDV